MAKSKDNSNKKQPIVVTGGLQPLTPDPRDYSFGAILGYANPAEVPSSWAFETIGVKHQRDTDFCAAHAACTVSEIQELVELSPEYIFARAKQISGDWRSWGLNLRDLCKACKEFGFLEEKDAIYNLDTDDRNTIANPANWPALLDEKARIHKKQAYFKIEASGDLDMFDAIRCAMWKFRHELRAVVTGTLWHTEWSRLIKIDTAITPSFGHAFAVIGWDNEYLMIQNSYGTEMGQGGIQYFHRTIVNRFFTFGAYMFADMPQEETKESAIAKSKKSRSTLIQRLIDSFGGLFSVLIDFLVKKFTVH